MLTRFLQKQKREGTIKATVHVRSIVEETPVLVFPFGARRYNDPVKFPSITNEHGAPPTRTFSLKEICTTFETKGHR